MEETKTKKRTRSRDVTFVSVILDNKALLILLAFCIALSFATDSFLTVTNITNVLRQISYSVVLGVGFTLTLGCGNLDLSVGAMLGLISMVACLLCVNTGIPFGFILVIAILLGVVLGMCNGMLSQFFAIPAMITTVATQNIFRGLTYVISRNTTVTGLSKPFIFMGQGYIGPIPFPILIMGGVVVLGYFVLRRTVFGRHCLAVGGNMEAARVSGINARRVKIYSFMWMGGCAGLAAIIFAGRVASGQVNAGNGMEMDIMAGVVIGGTTIGGGTGKMIGTVIGVLMVQVINNGMNLLNIDTNWQTVAKGALILIAVILDSQSEKIINNRRAKKNQKQKAAAEAAAAEAAAN